MNFKRILSLLLCMVMIFCTLPFSVSAETDLVVNDNKIDISDKSLQAYTITHMNISGATVVSAKEDGTTLNIILAAGTSPTAKITVTFDGTSNGGQLKIENNTMSLADGQGTMTVKTTAIIPPARPVNGANYTVSFSSVMGESVTVNTPSGEGFTFNGKEIAYKDSPYSFSVDVNEGYDGSGIIVKVNGDNIEADNGIYTVANVIGDMEITVEGIVKKEVFSVIAPSDEGFTFTGTDMVYKGENYTFEISVDNSYDSSEMAVVVNGRKLDGVNGKYTVLSVNEDITISVEGLIKKEIFNITSPAGKGFIFTGDTTVYKGDNYTFKVELKAGYIGSPVVKVNGNEISGADGSYLVTDVCEHLTITVEGIERAPISGIEIPVADNVINITDKEIHKLSGSIKATATKITIGGVEVESAYEDGTTLYVLLPFDTASDAEISITVGVDAYRSYTVSGNSGNMVLSDGEGELSLEVTAKYSSARIGKETYSVIFIRKEAPTAPPVRVVESDSKEIYKSTSTTLDLKSYFTSALRYYLVEENDKTLVCGDTYTFDGDEPGVYVLIFEAENDIGKCQDTVSVTITVKEIAGGVWIGHTTSNGSIDFVIFKDSEGNAINGIEAIYADRNIVVTLPKNYPINGKVKAVFSLTQNSGGYPFLSTSKDSVGASPATKFKFTEKEITLNSGAGTFSFYYFNSAPSGSNQETFKLTYKVANDKPMLSEGVEETAESAITAGDIYTLNLSALFTDADGDALTYLVSINGKSFVNADTDYTFTTDVAGTYTLVFAANDGKDTSEATYTVTLTVENSTQTEQMTICAPEDLALQFYVSTGFADGVDKLGAVLEAVKGETADCITSYTVNYPVNADILSFRAEGFGGMAFSAENNGKVILRKAQFSVVDYENCDTISTNTVSYGANTAVSGENGWLLVAGCEYIFTATPQNSDLATLSKTVTLEPFADTCIVQMVLGIKNPLCITVPTGAKAQLYKYNKYYSNEEFDAKIITVNDNGTTTYQFVVDTKEGGASYIYRVSMEGRITKAGWLSWGQQNLTVTYTENDKEPSYRLDNYYNQGEPNSTFTEDSVLLNANSRNHINLSIGQSTTLKAYRAWEIIPVSYNNYIIPPDFNFTVICGNDVIELKEMSSPSAADGDWTTLTALKEGVAVVEVTYDAIEVSGGNYGGVYGASDPCRTGLLVVQVGENNDESVKFGIDCFTSIGIPGSENITYNPDRQKEWDAEFDTLYFLDDKGTLSMKPAASSDICEVSLSHNKGLTWTALSGENGVYTAEIVPGNNILRVKTETGVAYQVVRGDKISVKLSEVSEKSDGDGIAEAGETVRVTFNGLHNPIPKMAGNYNPGYNGNFDGYCSQHINYTCDGVAVYGMGAQYNFITEANFVEIIMPDDGTSVTLSDGYIGLGVIGLTSFFDGGDSHRNIPADGCSTRGSQTTYHTRSILPKITVFNGDKTAPNTAPVVRSDAVSEGKIYSDQNFAINPDTLFADPDDDALTFTVSVSGAQAVEVPLDYKFVPSGTGTYTLLFTATDGKESVQHTITVTVTKRPVQEDPTDDFGLKEAEIAGYVTVSFVDRGVRVEGEKGLKYPTPLGTIVAPTKVPYKKGEKISHITKRLLDHLGIGVSYTGTLESGFYLGAISDFEVNGTPYDTMGEYDAGVGSGWMITLNKTFIDQGASEFEVKKGDVIKWQYTCQYGKDIGDPFWDGNDSIISSPKEENEPEEEKNEESEKLTFDENTFSDINKDDWHYESVKYVYENGLMKGTENGFEPESKMSRAMLVTVLYRMASPEKVENKYSFSDVSDEKWYSDAVLWASSNGIINGVSETEFAPDSDVSREQMALIIYRYAKLCGFDISGEADVSGFEDVENVSDWALEAIKWANKIKLINGTSASTLSPKDTATRAQVATILMRFCTMEFSK